MAELRNVDEMIFEEDSDESVDDLDPIDDDDEVGRDWLDYIMDGPDENGDWLL